MPTNTSNQQIPLPIGTDEPDVVGDLTTAVEFMEHQLVGFYATIADRDTREPNPQEGQLAFVRGDDSWYYYDGSTWVQLYIPTTPERNITVSSGNPTGGSNGDIHFKI